MFFIIDNVSSTVSAILDVTYKDDIPFAVQNILETDKCNDESILKVTTVLCKWLCSGCAANNLNLWIFAILHGLCNKRRFNILMDIAESIIKPLAKSIFIPMFTEKVMPIFILTLSSTLHTDKIFNIVSNKSNRLKYIKTVFYIKLLCK